MRKNDVRKWLHAILDLLPVLVIPVFALAVRSDNNFQPIEVQAQEKEVVVFNQLIINGDFDNDDYVSSYNTNYTSVLVTDNNASCEILNTSDDAFYRALQYNQSTSWTLNHKYLLCFDFNYDYSTRLTVELFNAGLTFNYTDLGLYSRFQSISTCNNVRSRLLFYIRDNISVGNIFYIAILHLFDLTLMYGSGNEPTLEEFNDLFYEDFYDYTKSQKMLVHKPVITTFNDSDVASQMIYTLYNATDKYFNLNNIFGFGNVWDWMLLNIFNGSAPLAVNVVWQIVLYEFVMDLIFLIYGLFMFFIDSCTNLMERFNCQLRGR